MSTKNIAPSSQVHERLARFKRESESFSRAIDRLISIAEGRHVGADNLKGLQDLPSLSEADAAQMERVVEQNRTTERWDRHDLR